MRSDPGKKKMKEGTNAGEGIWLAAVCPNEKKKKVVLKMGGVGRRKRARLAHQCVVDLQKARIKTKHDD